LPFLEASYWHLLIIPFHGGLQKVRGKVDGFTELIREPTLNEYSCENVKVKGEIAFGNSFCFQA
jgi:hypothetical protein